MLGKTKREQLVDAIRFFSEKGWTPATSSNFSYRENADAIVISRSGVDKSRFALNDLIQIDNQGKVLRPAGEKSSAETLIHCCVYKAFPKVKCVLHTHSVNGTVLSRQYISEGKVIFTGFEVLKAFEGVNTHDTSIELPVFRNTQDMKEFYSWLEDFFASHNGPVHGLLIEGHGLYTWGSSIEAAKRQIEAFEFLMECALLEAQLPQRGGQR